MHEIHVLQIDLSANFESLGSKKLSSARCGCETTCVHCRANATFFTRPAPSTNPPATPAASACAVQTAHMGRRSAGGGNSCWCPELEVWITHRPAELQLELASQHREPLLHLDAPGDHPNGSVPALLAPSNSCQAHGRSWVIYLRMCDDLRGVPGVREQDTQPARRRGHRVAHVQLLAEVHALVAHRVVKVDLLRATRRGSTAA